MNRLQFESSPYLLQHAGNPVDWWPWGEPAIDLARKENKPILVSIGYSACHWCHVMEHESFENEEVAAFMNEHFINIKVDREERPDIDQIYMDAVQAIAGSGGWPLNCFLLPDLKPFFGGTYFPPKPAYNRPSWMEVLKNIHHAFHNKADVVAEQSQRLSELIQNNDGVFIKPQEAQSGGESVNVHHIFSKIQKQFDQDFGGFGGAPKFPGFMALSFLTQYAFAERNAAAKEHVIFSFQKMIQGGIYDQIGGGLSRYSVDERWFAPHFEKMLYDNALFIQGLVEIYQYSGESEFIETARHTMAFISREMTDESGGFYAALDADSEGVEGKFYTWSSEELEELLAEDYDWFVELYEIQPEGNWEETNILARTESLATFAAQNDWELIDFKENLEQVHRKLRKARAKRIRPGLDDKRLLGWNAMMNIACLRMFTVTGEAQYLNIAQRNAAFIKAHMHNSVEGGLYHTFSKGKAAISAFLEDYAWYILMQIEWFQRQHDPACLEDALNMLQFVETHFADPQGDLFYFNADFQGDVLMRKLDFMDNATPSGNALLCKAYLQLAAICSSEEYSAKAARMLRQVQDSVSKYPLSFAYWAGNLLWQQYGAEECVITGPEAYLAAQRISREYAPFSIIVASKAEGPDLELLKYRYISNETWIYLCRNQSCEAPVLFKA